MTHFYSLFISSSALHLIAERSASVTADTSFKVFDLTRLRIEPSLAASKANALNHSAMALGTLLYAVSCLQLLTFHDLHTRNEEASELRTENKLVKAFVLHFAQNSLLRV